MKEYLIILLICIFNVDAKEEFLKPIKRITYKEIYDPDNTFYVLNTEDEYKSIKGLVKNELLTNSSTYTYEWSNHINNTYFFLKDSLPQADSEGYRDMTGYDLIYLNVFSKNNIGSKIILVIECQKREPDEKSNHPVCYKSHIIPINFSGWKEILIPYSILDDSYNADLTRVSRILLHSNGWDCVPNKDTRLFFDKISFSKIKYVFNMKESEISEDNYSNILNIFKYSFINSGNLLTENKKNIIQKLKSMVITANNTHKEISTKGLPFNYDMINRKDMGSIYNKIKQMAMGYAIKG